MKKYIFGIDKDVKGVINPFKDKDKKSEDVDDILLTHSTLVNCINKIDNDVHFIFSKDESNIIYLPINYVVLVRLYIVRLYENTKDPICTGFKNKGDLDYTLDFVKTMYNNHNSKKIKLVNKAAFIFYNICSKHPFTDGNKRTAIITCNSFLEYNGYTIGALPFRESHDFITDVAKGVNDEKECQKFINRHISKFQITKEFEQTLKKLLQNIRSKN